MEMVTSITLPLAVEQRLDLTILQGTFCATSAGIRGSCFVSQRPSSHNCPAPPLPLHRAWGTTKEEAEQGPVKNLLGVFAVSWVG